MKIERVSYSWNNRIRPHIEGDSVIYMELPASVVLTDGSVIVIDYFDRHKSLYDRRELHFFMDGPIKVNWGDLTDDQRLTVRTSIPWTIKPLIGEYKDDRYYTLEALSGS